MCGRYALFSDLNALKSVFNIVTDLDLSPNYNAGPGQDLPVIVHHKMGPAHWGYLPGWATDKNDGYKMMNARAETLHEKPAFRDNWEKGRRCLIPANGFYEWDHAGGTKKPYFVSFEDMSLFAFAGLWSKWNGLVTFTIITKEASANLQPCHPRMPVVLSPDQAQDWFKGDYSDALQLIGTATCADMQVIRVSERVGNVQNNDVGLIEPYQDEKDLLSALK